MNKSRLEAFTDAVVAIIITVMVMDLKRPQGGTLADLWALRGSFLVYLVSFATLAVYWHNHHHLLQVANTISGAVIWWNTLLLFLVSLFPFATAWVDGSLTAKAAEMGYGALMLAADVVWMCLTRALLRENGAQSPLARALAGSKRSRYSVGVILAGLAAGWFFPPAVLVCNLLSLVPWLLPDPHMEAQLRANAQH